MTQRAEALLNNSPLPHAGVIQQCREQRTLIVALLQKLNLQAVNAGCAIGDDWLPGSSRQYFASINPTTAQSIARVASTTAHDLDMVIQHSQEAFQRWRVYPAPKRGELIRQIALELRQYKSLLGELIALETGKIKQEADGEVQEMIDIADFAVGQARMLYGKSMHSERVQHQMLEQWHPLGPVAVITAFNFPVAVWAWNAFIAAICGDTLIWKPSHKAPLCAIAVQHICNRVMANAGFADVFSLVITNDNHVAEQLVSDKRIPLVSFTGSTAVGRQIAVNVAARLGKSLLELGGNNAVIVDESANLELAVPSIVFGAVGTAGQRCTTTRRVLVARSRRDELLARLVAAYQQITIGDPLDPATLMGPLIDESAVAAYVRALKQVQDCGGEIFYGGKLIKRAGYFVEPTIVSAQNAWPIVQTETFAPILYIIDYQDFSEALALQNDVPQGLSSALFSENFRHIERFIAATGSDCGLANVNIGTSGAEVGAAFGGEKETGGGREAGSDAWRAYMRRQTNTINWSNELPLAQGIVFNLAFNLKE